MNRYVSVYRENLVDSGKTFVHNFPQTERILIKLRRGPSDNKSTPSAIAGVEKIANILVIWDRAFCDTKIA